jgi:hypothetical protein
MRGGTRARRGGRGFVFVVLDVERVVVGGRALGEQWGGEQEAVEGDGKRLGLRD